MESDRPFCTREWSLLPGELSLEAEAGCRDFYTKTHLFINELCIHYANTLYVASTVARGWSFVIEKSIILSFKMLTDHFFLSTFCLKSQCQ